MKRIILALLLSLPSCAFALDVRYCTGDSVRVRSGHTTSASILTTINKGSAFNIIGISDNKETIQDKTDFWYKIVTDNNVTGWIFGAFVPDTGKKSSDKPSGVTVGSEYLLTTAWVFPEPKTDWEKKIALQYRSKVKVIENDGQISSAVDQLGHWTKIQCGSVTGWILDSFLTKSDDFNPTNASLYNICLFNSPQLMSLMQKECPDSGDIQKSLDCYSSIDIAKIRFNPAPEFNTNDTIIILTKTGMSQEKVGKLRLSFNEANGTCYLLFDTAKAVITYKEEKFIGFYINRKHYSKEMPVVLGVKTEPADNSICDSVSFYLSERPSREYAGKKPALIKKDLIKNYSIVCSPIESSDYRIYEFKPVKKENTWENFTAIFHRDQLVYCNFSSIITSFKVSDRIYLSINEWIPNTGCGGRKLLLFEEGMIKSVFSQFYYAN